METSKGENEIMEIEKPKSWADLSKLMGEDPDRTLFYNSFVTRDGRNPIPEPSGDYYLAQQGAFYLSDKESVAATFALVPGLTKYLQEAGLLQGRLIQLEMRKRINGTLWDFDLTEEAALNKYFGFANGSLDFTLRDRLERDGELVKTLKGRRPFGTFDNADLRQISRKINGEVPTPEDASYRANNKAEMRYGAEKFKYKIAEGLEAKDAGEFQAAVLELFNRGYKKVWAKSTNGYGGDLVRPIDNTEKIEIVFKSLNDALEKAKEYSSDLDHFNHPHSFVLEGDLQDKPGVDEIVANLNAQSIVSRDGKVTAIGMSEQLVSPEGAYLGNVFDEQGEKTAKYQKIVLEALQQVSDWVASVGYQGILGVDFIVAMENGAPVAYVIDSNARPNGSTSSLLLKNFLDKNVTLNTTLDFARLMVSFDQAREVLGEQRIFKAGMEKGVIPKMFHALNDGKSKLTSSKVTCDIVGESRAAVLEIMADLKALGIKI